MPVAAEFNTFQAVLDNALLVPHAATAESPSIFLHAAVSVGMRDSPLPCTSMSSKAGVLHVNRSLGERSFDVKMTELLS